LRERQSVMRVTRGLRERHMGVESDTGLRVTQSVMRATWGLREAQSVMRVTWGLRERHMGVERETHKVLRE
jgi:hypothetical protein